MPLLDKELKQKINEHEQKDAIGIGSRAFTKSLLAATEVATQIAKAPNTPSVATTPTEEVKEKLISSDIKQQIKESGKGEAVREFLDSFTPKLLKTLETVATIGGEVGASMAETAIESALPGDQGKKIGAMTKDVVKGTSESISAGVATTTDAIEKPLIHSDVKTAINKEHPHRDAFVKGIKSFFKKFLPVVEKVAEVGSQIGGEVAANAIETVVQGDRGKAVAKMTSVSITETGKGISTSIQESKTNTATKLLDPTLKAQIEEHPFREAVKEFFKNFLPKLLKVFETIATVGGAIGAEAAESAIKAAMPGKQGEMLAKMTGDMVEKTSKAIGAGVGNIKSTKVTTTEVKITPNQLPETHKLLELTTKVVDLAPHKVDLTGDHGAQDTTH